MSGCYAHRCSNPCECKFTYLPSPGECTNMSPIAAAHQRPTRLRISAAPGRKDTPPCESICRAVSNIMTQPLFNNQIVKFLIAVVVIFIATCISSGVNASVQLITNDGSFKSASAFMAKKSLASKVSVNSIIDCGFPNGCKSINNLLSTDFTEDSTANSLCLDVSADNSAVYLYSNFNTMFSPKFCGSKATDYSSDISTNVILAFSSSTLSQALQNYEQVIRRIFNRVKLGLHASSSDSNKVSCLTVIVGNTGNSESEGDMKDKVSKALIDIWADMTDKSFDALQEKLNINVIVTDLSSSDSIASSSQAVTSSIGDESKVAKVDSGSLASSLGEAWKKIQALGAPKALLSQSQKQSLFIIDAAYNSGVIIIENTVSQMRGRVGSGRLVGNFGERVLRLQEGVQKAFFDGTIGVNMIKNRAERGRDLAQMVLGSTNVLFKQQVNMCATKVTNEYKDELVRLASKDEEQTPDEQQQTIRKFLFNFRTSISDLEVESMGLSGTASYEQLAADLQQALADFPESPAAKLETVRKMDRVTKKPKKKKKKGSKGGRAVNIALNLVGMLRPPGYGNLQGFVGYSTGLLGLPLELMLGVQNDGDSPEVVGEDREYPLLRLQPKVHFDIDL